MNISILGGGAFGITLALHLSKRHQIKVWEFFQERVDILNQGHCPLIDMPLNNKITISTDFEETLKGSDLVIIAVASNHVRKTVETAKAFNPEKAVMVLASKGFDDSLDLLSDVVKSIIPNKLATFYGPTIAKELARGVTTGAVVASEDQDTAIKVAGIFADESLHIDICNDMIGCQIGGALKNIYAVWGGIIDGLNLGSNTKALLMTRGLQELKTLGLKMNAHAETFYTLAGLGDLIVTCTSPNSRNRTFGEKLGKGKTMDQALSEMSMVVEGIHTVKIAVKLAEKFKVKMPLAEELYEVLFNDKSPKDALKEALK